LVSNKIDFEFKQIEEELEILAMLKAILKSDQLDKIQLRAAASSLHSIYNGIEKILYQVLKENDITLKSDSRWHIELLDTAKTESILTDHQHSTLKEYMGFRHFFRHNYGFMLDTELIQPLLMKIHTIIEDLKLSIIESDTENEKS
jgi:hypothetical protein